MEKNWPDNFEELLHCSTTCHISGPRINLEGLHRSSKEEFVYLISSLNPEYLVHPPPITASRYTTYFQKVGWKMYVYRTIYRLEDIKTLLIFLSVSCRGINDQKFYYIEKFE